MMAALDLNRSCCSAEEMIEMVQVSIPVLKQARCSVRISRRDTEHLDFGPGPDDFEEFRNRVGERFIQKVVEQAQHI